MERALCPVLIGREPEVTTLEDALLEANRGHGQIVLLAGEAGLGKTRLATELQGRAVKIGMTVLWGGCSEAELSLPYLPFLEAIGNYLSRTDLDRVREQLGPVRRELAHLFPQLEPDSTSREQGDPTQARLRLFEAILALLRLPATAQGLLIVLEDLHWSDASTRELLDYMARRLSGMRLLILGTYRSDELHRKHPLAPIVQGWRRSRAAQVIQLDPLRPDGIGEMIRAIFDEREVTPEFQEFLYGRSEGNPFVAEELLKAALDRGDIYRGETRWERKEVGELRLPQTVTDMIMLRVERLSPEQTEVLQAAAVLGPSCSYQALVALSGKDEATVQAALHASIQQQLMEEDPQSNGRYRFRHALTRESVYEDMIAPRREQLHAQAASMLAEQPGTAPMDLAYHLFAANRWSEAIPVGIKAAEDAERGQAYREAAALYERLLSHVNDDLTRGQLQCRLGDAYLLATDPARGQQYLEQGIPLLEKMGQQRDAAHYRLILGRCYWERSRPQDARAEYERAREELETEGPSEDLAVAYIRLAGLHMFELEDDACHALAARAIEVAEAVGAHAARIWARVFLGGALCGQGQPEEGFGMMDASFRDAMAGGFHWIARNALHNTIVMRCALLRAREALPLLEHFRGLRVGGRPTFMEEFDHGNVWLALGEVQKARRHYETALVLAREGESSTAEIWIQEGLAVTTALLGRPREALALLPAPDAPLELQDAVRITQLRIEMLRQAGDDAEAARQSSTVLDRSYWGAMEVRHLYDSAVNALLSAGRRDEAERLAARSRDLAGHLQQPYQDRMEGRLALANGEPAKAVDRLRAATQAFHDAGYAIDETRTRRVLAMAEMAVGDHAMAESELRTALEIAGAHGAIADADAAREQLAEMGVLQLDREPPAASDEPVQTTERLVTVLFLDIRGYTAMTAREAPERVVDTVAALYRWARQEIERHAGLVDKYEGDAVMGTFNVIGARLDHCLQALQAAIAIRDKAAAAGLPIGIGIAVGPAVVGKLTAGSPISTFGEVTNLASRLQGQAAPGEILLTEEAYRRTQAWLAEHGIATQRNLVDVKGYSAAVPVFRLPAGARAGSVG